jgi:hypothetical protein
VEHLEVHVVEPFCDLIPFWGYCNVLIEKVALIGNINAAVVLPSFSSVDFSNCNYRRITYAMREHDSHHLFQWNTEVHPRNLQCKTNVKVHPVGGGYPSSFTLRLLALGPEGNKIGTGGFGCQLAYEMQIRTIR